MNEQLEAGGIVVTVRTCEPGEHSNYVWICDCGKRCWIATTSDGCAHDAGERHLREHGEVLVGLIGGHVERLPAQWECPAGGPHVYGVHDESPAGPSRVVHCNECGATPKRCPSCHQWLEDPTDAGEPYRCDSEYGCGRGWTHDLTTAVLA